MGTVLQMFMETAWLAWLIGMCVASQDPWWMQVLLVLLVFVSSMLGGLRGIESEKRRAEERAQDKEIGALMAKVAAQVEANGQKLREAEHAMNQRRGVAQWRGGR